MPAYYQEYGYNTRHVGKWHLGFAHWSQTPTARGFDQSYMGLGGYMDYWTFAAASPPMCQNEQGIHVARDMYNATKGENSFHHFKKVDVDQLEAKKEYLTYHMTNVAVDMLQVRA